MIDMRVKIAGVEFKNPVIAASGTFGFGREFDKYYDISKLGGISVKAVTAQSRLGNDTPRIAETPSGMLNAVGLQNPGVDAFIKEELPFLLSKDIVIIANVAGATADEYCEVAEKLADTGVHMLELNISCPNVSRGGVAFGTEKKTVEDITRRVKSVCRKPLMVKLSPNVTDIAGIAAAAQNGGADAISLINTLTGMAIDAYSRKPVLANITGGLSGRAVKPVALRMVHQVSRAVDIPIIGMGGIYSGVDAAEFMICGASAVMVGSANLSDPYASVTILKELEAFCRETNTGKVSDLVGTLKL